MKMTWTFFIEIMMTLLLEITISVIMLKNIAPMHHISYTIHVFWLMQGFKKSVEFIFWNIFPFSTIIPAASHNHTIYFKS
jgi:hypothetical protein